LLFARREVGIQKTFVMAARVEEANGRGNEDDYYDIEFKTFESRLDDETADILLHETDVVLDGSDNFDTKLLINQTCVRKNIPWVYASVAGEEGTVMPVIPGVTPCLHCRIFNRPEEEITIDQIGAIGPIVSMIASMQALEALKILLNRPLDEIHAGMWHYDVWNGIITPGSRERFDRCPMCKDK